MGQTTDVSFALLSYQDLFFYVHINQSIPFYTVVSHEKIDLEIKTASFYPLVPIRPFDLSEKTHSPKRSSYDH